MICAVYLKRLTRLGEFACVKTSCIVRYMTTDACPITGKTIAIIDDHALFLEGLAGMLRTMTTDVRVATFQSGVRFLEALGEGLLPDLVLTDLTMKAMNGFAVVQALRRTHPETPVLIVSGTEAVVVEREVAASGAQGFVQKSCSPDALEKAIALALSTPVRSLGQNGDLLAQHHSAINELSKRQMEVLELLVIGASNKEISAKLAISDNTVKTHLKAIFAALGVNRRSASIQKARALGLI